MPVTVSSWAAVASSMSVIDAFSRTPPDRTAERTGTTRPGWASGGRGSHPGHPTQIAQVADRCVLRRPEPRFHARGVFDHAELCPAQGGGTETATGMGVQASSRRASRVGRPPVPPIAHRGIGRPAGRPTGRRAAPRLDPPAADERPLTRLVPPFPYPSPIPSKETDVTIVQEHSSPTQPDLAAIKQRQQATWASGDYHMIGTQILIVSE